MPDDPPPGVGTAMRMQEMVTGMIFEPVSVHATSTTVDPPDPRTLIDQASRLLERATNELRAQGQGGLGQELRAARARAEWVKANLGG